MLMTIVALGLAGTAAWLSLRLSLVHKRNVLLEAELLKLRARLRATR